MFLGLAVITPQGGCAANNIDGLREWANGPHSSENAGVYREREERRAGKLNMREGMRQGQNLRAKVTD